MNDAIWTRSFLILLAGGLANFLAIGAVAPLLPRHVTGTLGGSDFMVGLVIGSMAFSAVAARPWAARAANRRGRRVLAFTGAVVTWGSLVAYALAPDVVTLGAARLVTGVGQALFFTGAATMLTELAPASRRGAAISYFSVAVYLGIGFGPAIGEWVYTSASITWGFLAAAGFALLAAAISLGLPETMALDDDDATPVARVHRAALLPGVVLALGMTATVTFNSYMPLYSDELDMGGPQWVFLAFAVTVIVVRAFGAGLPDLLGPGRSGTIATVTIAVGMASMALFATPAGLYLGAVVLALGISFHYPSLMSLVVGRTSQRERSAAVATFTAFFDVAMGVGGVAIGAVAAVGGYRSTFAAAALAAAAGLAVLRLAVLRPAAGPLPERAPTTTG